MNNKKQPWVIRRCQKCGWRGSEIKTIPAGDFLYGCPVCRDCGRYQPTDKQDNTK